MKGFGTGEDSIVFSWGLNRIEDKNGNYLDIRYAANYATGEFYPEVINYGASDNSAKWYVHFGYEDRTDIIKNHIAGRSLSITKRLSSLTTSRGNQPNLSPIRNYILHYETDDTHASRSRITSIEECAAIGGCYNKPITIVWRASGSPDYVGQNASVGLTSGDEFGQWNWLADMNGDGLADIIRAENSGSTDVEVHLMQPNGVFDWQGLTSYDVIQPPDTADKGINQWNELADVNSDGILDIFTIHFEPALRQDEPASIRVHYGRQDGRFAQQPHEVAWDTAVTQLIDYNSNSFRYSNQLIDMDGDGVLDVFSVPSGSNHFNISYGSVDPSNGRVSYGAPVSYNYSATRPWLALAEYGEKGFRETNFLADVNGDGRVDIIKMHIQSEELTAGISVLINSPHSPTGFTFGLVQDSVLSAALTEGANYDRYLNYFNQFVDVNGDGMLDVVSLRTELSSNTRTPAPVEEKYHCGWLLTNNLEESTPYEEADCAYHYVNYNTQLYKQDLAYNPGATDPDENFQEQITNWLNKNTHPDPGINDAQFLQVNPAFSHERYFGKVLYRTPKLMVALGNGDGSFDMVDAGTASSLLTVPEEMEIYPSSINKQACDPPNDQRYSTLTNSPNPGDTGEIIVKEYSCDGGGYYAVGGKGLSQDNQFADIDNDGYVDIVSVDESGATYVAYGKGDGTFANRTALLTLTSDLSKGFRAWNRIADMNGDGVADFFSVDAASNINAYYAQHKIPSLAKSFENGYGLITEITSYKPLTDPSVHGSASGGTFPMRTVRMPMHVVDAYEVKDAPSFNYKYELEYEYARVDIHRGWAGFSRIIKNNLQTSPVTQTVTKYLQDFPFTGRAAYVLTRVAGEGNISRVDYNWGSRAANGTYFVYLDDKTEKVYEPNDNYAVAIAVTTDYQDKIGTTDTTPYDEFGNPELVEESNTHDGHVITTTYTNDYDLSSLHEGQLTSQTVAVQHAVAPGNQATRTTTRTFDGLGRIKTESTAGGSADAKTVIYGYDSYGNVNSIEERGENGNYNEVGEFDELGSQEQLRKTTYLYAYGGSGGDWTQTETVFGAVNHITTTTYDGDTGRPIDVTDPNLIKTRMVYDGFGRLTTTTKYYGTANAVAASTEYRNTCPLDITCRADTVFIVKQDPAGADPIYTQYDALGREVRVSQPDDSGSPIYTDMHYDEVGRLWGVTTPHPGSASHFTGRWYDKAGRVHQITHPNGMVTDNDYDGLRTTVTRLTEDEGPQTTIYDRDSQGQIVAVTDAKNHLTQYQYKPFGLLWTVTDAMNNVTTLGYDGLGNKTSQNDPDLGLWEYKYNAFGELKWQKDAKAQVTTFDYDQLGRMTERRDYQAGGAEVVTDWGYDTQGKGLLDSVSRDGVTVSYGYDALKRPRTEETNIGGTETYTVVTGYDAQDRVQTVDYPSDDPNADLVIQYNYNPNNGLLEKVTESGTANEFWRADGFNLYSQVDAETWGNGVSGTRGYDPLTGRLTAIANANGGQAIQDLDYQYYQSGNLRKRSNGSNGATERFVYDPLDRLTDIIPGSGDPVQYNYNAIGNIENKTGVGVYSYGDNGAGAHAVTSIDLDATGLAQYQYSQSDVDGTIDAILADSAEGTDCTRDTLVNVLDVLCINRWRAEDLSNGLTYSYGYDNNGNMTSGPDRAISYTHFNKPDTLEVTGTMPSVTTFGYGPDHQRLTKQVDNVNGQVTTTYIGKLYERIEEGGGIEERFYINAAGRLVAQVNKDANGSAIYYAHTDLLGSVEALTDETGALVSADSKSFDAYGDARAADWGSGAAAFASTARGYTGHETDTESGLINMSARLYDPFIGRFVSADTVVSDAYDPQNLNRYSYVLNNPFAYTDPTGHEYLTTNNDFAYFDNGYDWFQPHATYDFQTGYYLFSDGSSISPDGTFIGADANGFSQQVSWAQWANCVGPECGYAGDDITASFSDSVLFEPELAEFYRQSDRIESLTWEVTPIGAPEKIGGAIIGTIFSKFFDDAVKYFSKFGDNVPKETKSLYHYTDDAGLDGILSSKKLNPSLKANNPKDARFGDGQYLSDIAPGTKTCAQLSRCFIGQPFQGNKFKNYVEIDVTDLNVVKGRDGVFVLPNDKPLDLTNRILGSGAN